MMSANSANDLTSVAFYDTLWAGTRRVDEHHKCRAHAIEKMLRRIGHADRSRAMKILEPACGSGIISRTLARWGQVTGFDQSRVGVEQARASVAGTFFVGQLPAIDVAGDDFDVCVLSQVIEHFGRQDQMQLLRNIRRRIRTDGHLILTTPNAPVSSRMRFRNGELQPVENWLAPADLVDLLNATGWRTARLGFCFSFLPVLTSRLPWLRPLRYVTYTALGLRPLIEDWLESRGAGDTTVVLARKA